MRVGGSFVYDGPSNKGKTEANVNPCGRCGYETEGHLCEICSASTIRALALTSTLVGDLRARMTDLRATPSDRIVVDSSRERTLGADFDLSDRAHALYSQVADWVISWHPIVGRDLPSFMQGWNPDAAVARIPADVVATQAARTVSSWLIASHDRIAEHEDAGRYANDVIDAIKSEADVIGYRPRPRRVPKKLCRTCRAPNMRVFWPIDGEPTLKCGACGGEWPCGPVLSQQIFARN